MRVLIIEDCPDVAESMRLFLDLLGYDTQVALDGLAGVRAATAWCPDAILCDIGLPGQDGYAVARALRADPRTAGVRLIAITGHGAEEDPTRAFASGFEHHFTKPVEVPALLPLLSAVSN